MRSRKPFIHFRQKGKDMYLGVLSISELRGNTFIDRYNPNLPVEHPEQGYQRNLTPKRVNDFANYLLKDNDATFGALTYNIRDGVDIDENGYIELTPEMLASLDGQHREAGTHKASVSDPSYLDMEVAVIIYDGLPIQAERKVFYDMNKHQKNVPVALCKQIMANFKKDVPIHELKTLQEKSDRIACNVYRIMNSDPNSIWYNKLYEPNEGTIPKKLIYRSMRDRNRNDKLLSLGIWMETLNRIYSALEQCVSISEWNEEAQTNFIVGLLNDYWNAIEEVSDDAIFAEPFQYIIMSSKGVRLLHEVLRSIIAFANDTDDDELVITYDTFIEYLSTIDWFEYPDAWKNTKDFKGELIMSMGTRGSIQTEMFLNGRQEAA